jgi:radical SAM-linked protein
MTTSLSVPESTTTAAATATQRVRLRFAKRGDLRLVSHHDVVRAFERMLRRAELPVAHSQGFNPRPKVVFPLSLALGIEGRREIVELELTEPLEPALVLDRLSAVAPPGLALFEPEALMTSRAGQVRAVRYELPIPAERRTGAAAAIGEFLRVTERPYIRHREGRRIPIDLRPFVIALTLDEDGFLRLNMQMSPGGSARPEEVLEALGLRELLDHGAILVRTELELAAESLPVKPARPAATEVRANGSTPA